MWSGEVMWPGSMNGWGYGLGNPIKYTDPSGNDAEPPEPFPWTPLFNIDNPFAFNGYIEGANWLTSILSQIIDIEGIEIVYDFVTHERARFTYHGKSIPLACGTIANSLYDSTVSIYAGTYDFLGFSDPQTHRQKGIKDDYEGPFFNFSASYTPLSLNLPFGGKPFPVGANIGVGYFCATTPGILGVPGIQLNPAQCGVSLGVGIGSSGNIVPGLPFEEAVYYTAYQIDPTTLQHYSSLAAMQTDILLGWNAPAAIVSDLYLPARAAAAAAAQSIWYWQANFHPGE
jgi:hypothetical protein